MQTILCSSIPIILLCLLAVGAASRQVRSRQKTSARVGGFTGAALLIAVENYADPRVRLNMSHHRRNEAMFESNKRKPNVGIADLFIILFLTLICFSCDQTSNGLEPIPPHDTVGVGDTAAYCCSR